MNASSFLSRQSVNVCRACRRDLLRRFSTSRAPRISFQSYPLSQPPPPAPSPQDQARGSPPLPRLHETRPPAGLKVGLSMREGEIHKTEPALAVKPEAEDGPTPAGASEPQTAKQPASETASPSQPSATTASGTAPTTTSAPSKRPSRLRTPRKAAIRLSPAAIAHLRRLLDEPTPQLIKIGVRNRGCSGLAYHLDYVEKPGPFDEIIEQDGVKVLIDSKALFSIIGSEMDWVENNLQESFKFNNPNIKEQCGCGESFMV